MAVDPPYLDSMRRAEEFVKAARLCYENKLYNAAAARAYYGVLHAAMAALVCFAKNYSVRSLMQGKTHKRVAESYDDEFVNRRKLFPDHSGLLQRVRARREIADYSIAKGISEKEARDSVASAERLLGDVKERITDEKGYY